ncbi:hypothetical protein Tco_0684513, partial [Tanacetum coccineum]
MYKPVFAVVVAIDQLIVTSKYPGVAKGLYVASPSGQSKNQHREIPKTPNPTETNNGATTKIYDRTPAAAVRKIEPGQAYLHLISSEVSVKFRHNLVRNILVDICSKVGVMMRKDALMGFLSEDGKDLRHANLLLFNWLQGKDACLDVTYILPFIGIEVTCYSHRGALHNVMEKKKRKYAST